MDAYLNTKSKSGWYAKDTKTNRVILISHYLTQIAVLFFSIHELSLDVDGKTVLYIFILSLFWLYFSPLFSFFCMERIHISEHIDEYYGISKNPFNTVKPDKINILKDGDVDVFLNGEIVETYKVIVGSGFKINTPI